MLNLGIPGLPLSFLPAVTDPRSHLFRSALPAEVVGFFGWLIENFDTALSQFTIFETFYLLSLNKWYTFRFKK